MTNQEEFLQVRIEVIRPNDPRLGDIISLGDASRKTVGLFPRAAYVAEAEKGTILIAISDDRVVGYALYRLPRNEVILTHLVVAQDARRKGVARALVNSLQQKYPQRSGIYARCRKDYNLEEMWQNLGFHPRGEVAGRGKDKKPLVVWALNNEQHVDLLTPLGEPLLKAAIDFNILRDIHDKPERRGASESISLVAQHLANQLHLVATPQLFREISEIEDGKRRSAYLSAIDVNYRSLPGDSREADRLVAILTEEVQKEFSNYPTTPQDQKDLRHLGEAAACGLSVFVTRDEALITKCGSSALQHLGLRVLRPADLIVRMDELTRADAYRPAAVYGTGFTRSEVGSGMERELLIFQAHKERRPDFLSILRAASSKPEAWQRTLVRDADNNPIMLCCSRIVDGILDVAILRTIESHRLSTTITQQMLFELRRQCRASSLGNLRISDPHLQPAVRRAAVVDGFVDFNDKLFGLVVNVCSSANDVNDALRHMSAKVGMVPPIRLHEGMLATGAAEAERVLWPAKVIDSGLQSYIIPIQPRWSRDLFGVPVTLPLFRDEELGLGREHVYYRSPRGPRLEAPARILWYKSQGLGSDWGASAIIACSLLEEIAVDTPQMLHDRFHRLGVWSEKNIKAAARGGVAQALRFSNTEILHDPVSKHRLREIFQRHNFKGSIQQPRGIPAELFSEIYQEASGEISKT